MSDTVIWHDVECGSYTADLPLWEELAVACDGPVLELGCGTGRVVRHLAKRTGRLIIGLDRDADLVGALWDRSFATVKSSADAEISDVRTFDLAPRFQLVLAPMQMIQLLDGRGDRIRCLTCVHDHLASGGRVALAIVEEVPDIPTEELAPPIPDVCEIDRRVYSSLPLPPELDDERVVLRRLRQTVNPTGDMNEDLDEVALCRISADALEQEAVGVGLQPLERRAIPATEAHVGSTVVLLEKGV